MVSLKNKGFAGFFIIISLIALIDLISGLFEYQLLDSNLVWFDYFLNFFGFALSPLVPLLLGRILFNGKQSNYPYYIYLAYVVGLIFMVAFKQIFSINDFLVYKREAGFYYYYLLFYIAAFIYLFVQTALLWGKFIYSNPFILLILFFAMVGAMVVQVYAELVHLSYAVICIVVVIYYSYMCALWSQLDGLTGLYSQFMFLNMIEKVKTGDIIFVMDVDDFKDINDKLGHTKGDEVLIRISKIINEVFGKLGRCYRIGGDEFAAIIQKDRDITGLVESFKLKVRDEYKNIQTTVSIGYAKFSENEDKINITSLADKRMYLDKARNKKQDSCN